MATRPTAPCGEYTAPPFAPAIRDSRIPLAGPSALGARAVFQPPHPHAGVSCSFRQALPQAGFNTSPSLRDRAVPLLGPSQGIGAGAYNTSAPRSPLAGTPGMARAYSRSQDSPSRDTPKCSY